MVGWAARSSDAYLLQDRNDVTVAVVMVLISVAFMLTLPRLFSTSPKFDVTTAPHMIRGMNVVAFVNFAAAVVLFVASFAQFGSQILINLLLAESTARTLMTFENTSSGAAQSLMGLLQIVLTFTALFTLAFFAMARRINSTGFFFGVLTVVLLLISTGTRSVFLMAIFAIVMGVMHRGGAQSRNVMHRGGVQSRKRRFLSAKVTDVPYLALNVTALIGIILVIVARFRDSPSELAELLLSSVSAHNDMFRELLFVMGDRAAYSSDLLGFLITPVSFAMPSFLGFDKSIPEHLVQFNLYRANIDLIGGAGNVFPGLLGEAYLAAGIFAPLVVTGLIGIILSAFNRAAARGRYDLFAIALLIALLAHFMISVRNLQGSLAIIAVLAIGFRILLRKLAR